MMRRLRLFGAAAGLVLIVLTSPGCQSSPTTVLLQIGADLGVTRPDELRLSIYSPRGTEMTNRRVPESGAPQIPGELLLYPPLDSGQLRIQLRANAAGVAIGEGTVQVELDSGAQVVARVTLQPGLLPDLDGDGVPDAIDSCPDRSNPAQGKCLGGGDGGFDGALDGGADAGLPDASEQGDTLSPDLVNCDKDGDTFLSKLCGGTDCDDTNVAVHPGELEGPLGNATCTDGLDNDCDGKQDGLDTGCWACKKDGDCKDGNPCTSDLCAGGSCSNPPANQGGTCTDGLYCTVSDACASGVCAGKPRSCAAVACQTGSCNEVQDKCTYTAKPDGTSCDDKNTCTQGESCKVGACKAPGPVSESIEIVNVRYLTDRSTRLDSKGLIHTVYYDNNNKRLKYATNASGAWKAEVVDSSSSEVGAWPTVAVDVKDQPHIAYLDETNKKLKHAVKTSKGWDLSTISPNAVGHTSIAVDKSGKFHISFLRQGTLWYAVGKPNAWALVQADKTSGAGILSSLAVDKNGKVHIAHGEGSPPFGATKLRYTTNAVGGKWTTVIPASLPKSHGSFPSITISPAGDLFISHYSEGFGPLFLTSRIGGTWKTEVPDPTTNCGSFSSIALDSMKKVHIAYRSVANGELRYTTNAAGTWKTKVLYSVGNSGRWTSLARAASGTIHIIFEDNNVPQLRHYAFSACP